MKSVEEEKFGNLKTQKNVMLKAYYTVKTLQLLHGLMDRNVGSFTESFIDLTVRQLNTLAVIKHGTSIINLFQRKLIQLLLSCFCSIVVKKQQKFYWM